MRRVLVPRAQSASFVSRSQKRAAFATREGNGAGIKLADRERTFSYSQRAGTNDAVRGNVSVAPSSALDLRSHWPHIFVELEGEEVADRAVRLHALILIWPQYLVYAATFATIGIMWLNHHALLERAQRITHGVIVANFCLLALICFLPFTTYALEQLGLTSPAAVFYGLTNVAIGYSFMFLQRAVLKAHGRRAAPFTPWNFVGLLAYPDATIVAIFAPLLGPGLHLDFLGLGRPVNHAVALFIFLAVRGASFNCSRNVV